MEILLAMPAVRNLIRKGETHQIVSYIQAGKKYGMALLDDAIMEPLNKGWIDPDEAHAKARFRSFLKNPSADFIEGLGSDLKVFRSSSLF